MNYDTKSAGLFSDEVAPLFKDLGVGFDLLHRDEREDVLAIHIQLPANADVIFRRRVLAILSSFEADHDYTLITSPTFTWADEPVSV